MVLATSCFACLDTLSKVLVAHYPAQAIVWLRYLLQTLVMGAIFLPRMGARLVRTGAPGLQLLRGLFLVAASIVFVVALSHMQLAEAATIVFLAPVLVALAGGPLLGERVPVATWWALGGGFTGVLLIMRPGGASFSWAYLLPLFCAFCFAGYQLLTRKLAAREDPITTLFYPGFIACLAIPAAFPGSALEVPSGVAHGAMLAAIGVLGGVGHFLLIRAHALAPATLLAPFGYAQLVVVLVLGWLVFGQLPDALGFGGMALVAASGVVVILGSRRRTHGNT
ncbi:MAG TPA: DMT family transporter [Burkholderiales bacterium]|nr:DMT family transporter [Burkholderiales bacterium]